MRDKMSEYFDNERRIVLSWVLFTSIGLSLGIDAVQRQNLAETVMIFVGLTGVQAYLVYKWSYYHTLSQLAVSDALAEAKRQLADFEAKHGKI